MTALDGGASPSTRTRRLARIGQGSRPGSDHRGGFGIMLVASWFSIVRGGVRVSMNYLAHVFLARGPCGHLVGSLMGDFVKGPVPDTLPDDVRRGVIQHRRIDSYTDRHESVYACKRLVSPGRRRFAGIMVDIFFDHFLACHWSSFSDLALSEFTGHVYDALYRHWRMLPDRLQRILPVMAREDWLGSYRHIDAIHMSIDGISRYRLRRRNGLYRGAVELERNYNRFQARFLEFFPSLMEFAETGGRGKRSIEHDAAIVQTGRPVL